MLNTWNKISSKAKNDCRGHYDSMTIAVLIVEDEFLLRMDAASFIEDAGFTGYEASNSDEALRVLETNDNIRVVFTDISMPGSIDGLKLAHYVRGRCIATTHVDLLSSIATKTFRTSVVDATTANS
jgi:CheY-like chemotaxis protein